MGKIDWKSCKNDFAAEFTASQAINAPFHRRVATMVTLKLMRSRFTCRRFKHRDGVHFTSKYAIKSFPKTSLVEANTMAFVARHTSIPVPKVHCAFTFRKQTYLVMSRMPGEWAGHLWVERTEESKAAIMAQLRSMVAELRSIPRPDGDVAVCNVDGGALFDTRFPSKDVWGPFATTRDFHLAMRGGVETYPEGVVEKHPELGQLLEFHDQCTEPPVFTHGDLSSFNILLEGDRVTGIIDWETAGWMPPYWEYTSSYRVSPQNGWWKQYVGEFITPLPHAWEMDEIRDRYHGALADEPFY